MTTRTTSSMTGTLISTPTTVASAAFGHGGKFNPLAGNGVGRKEAKSQADSVLESHLTKIFNLIFPFSIFALGAIAFFRIIGKNLRDNSKPSCSFLGRRFLPQGVNHAGE
ncbi:hypothetical protein CCP4SC76_4260013 [Gammaproteobacteria bacterium]